MAKDRHYATVLRVFVILALSAWVLFLTALCVAVGPALDWRRNYERTECTVNSIATTGLVECSIPGSELQNSQDKGLFIVPCVQINVTYTNSSNSTRISEIAMPRRGVLIAEYSAGSQQRVYLPTDYIGEPIPGPSGRRTNRRMSTISRPLFATRSCSFMDCRRDPAEATRIAEAIGARYTLGMTLPCFIYKPRQATDPDISALVVLKQAQTDSEVLAWSVTTMLFLLLTFPFCVFICCREWLCDCPAPYRNFQYF